MREVRVRGEMIRLGQLLKLAGVRDSGGEVKELLAGWPAARRALGITLLVDAVREYVVTGRRVPSSWVWRKLSGAPPANQETRPTAPTPS